MGFTLNITKDGPNGPVRTLDQIEFITASNPVFEEAALPHLRLGGVLMGGSLHRRCTGPAGVSEPLDCGPLRHGLVPTIGQFVRYLFANQVNSASGRGSARRRCAGEHDGTACLPAVEYLFASCSWSSSHASSCVVCVGINRFDGIYIAPNHLLKEVRRSCCFVLLSSCTPAPLLAGHPVTAVVHRRRRRCTAGCSRSRHPARPALDLPHSARGPAAAAGRACAHVRRGGGRCQLCQLAGVGGSLLRSRRRQGNGRPRRGWAQRRRSRSWSCVARRPGSDRGASQLSRTDRNPERAGGRGLSGPGGHGHRTRSIFEIGEQHA